jgi:hypothetical protein
MSGQAVFEVRYVCLWKIDIANKQQIGSMQTVNKHLNLGHVKNIAYHNRQWIQLIFFSLNINRGNR